MNVFECPGGAIAVTAQEAVEWYKGLIHTASYVHGQMILQIMSDYHCLPNIDRMTLNQIVFF